MKYLFQNYPGRSIEEFERLSADERQAIVEEYLAIRRAARRRRRRAAAAGRDRDDRARPERRDAAHRRPLHRREGAPGRLPRDRGGRSGRGDRDRRADPGRADGRRGRGAAAGREVGAARAGLPRRVGPRPRQPGRLPRRLRPRRGGRAGGVRGRRRALAARRHAAQPGRVADDHGPQPRDRPPAPRPHARREDAPARGARGRGGRDGRDDLPDERLELIFTCCHPALGLEAQVALTLRALGGLTHRGDRARVPRPRGDDEAAALAGEAQDQGRRHPVPRSRRPRCCPERLAAVLAVVYLIFNEGYGGRVDLAAEALRLGAALAELMPDEPEVHGLHGADAARRRAPRGPLRRTASSCCSQTRTARAGTPPRSRRGRAALDRAFALRGAGAYVIQAAIASLHMEEPRDWPQIAALYGELVRLTGSPVVELNRAIAVAEAAGPEAGLALVDRLEPRRLPVLPLDPRRPAAPPRPRRRGAGRVRARPRAHAHRARAPLPASGASRKSARSRPMSSRRRRRRQGMTHIDTHVLDTADAQIVYDVRGPLPAADGRPPLFMIGQPMDAGGFSTLASYFPDRTVVTYDPRGLGRSTRTDGRTDHAPTVQAEDVHAVIEALGAGPVELFASSGGAVTALALVAAHPGDVATLVAHEPPLIPVLPDAAAAERARAGVRDAYEARGPRRRDGGLHRDDLVAGRVHRRVLRPARRRSRRVRDAGRGRRLARRPAAVRPLLGGQQLPPGRRRADGGAHADRDRRGRGVRRRLHRTHVGGHRPSCSASRRRCSRATTAASSAASSATPASPRRSPTPCAASSTAESCPLPLLPFVVRRTRKEGAHDASFRHRSERRDRQRGSSPS